MSLRIETLSTLHEPDYQNWVKRNGDIFAHPDWISIQASTSQTYIIKDDSNWLGTFTLNQEKKWGIPLFRNPHFTPHIAWTWKHSAIKTTTQHTIWKEASSLMCDLFKRAKISKIQISFPPTVTDVQKFIWEGFNVTPKYTYQIQLKNSTEKIFEQFSSSHRNHISKAIKDQVEWKIMHDPSLMEKLVRSTFSRKKQKFHSQYLHQILHQFCNEKNAMMCFAYRNEVVIAGALVIHDQEKAYLLLSGYESDKKHGGAGIGCVWELIKKCQNSQIPIFDFEGSMLTEVEQYFRGFGGELVPYFMIEKKLMG